MGGTYIFASPSARLKVILNHEVACCYSRVDVLHGGREVGWRLLAHGIPDAKAVV